MAESENQEEFDFYGEKLSEGGTKERCRWLADKFGVSWQIVPGALLNMLKSDSKGKTAAVTLALLKMNKLIISDPENGNTNAKDVSSQKICFFRLNYRDRECPGSLHRSEAVLIKNY